jgi:hypothetical protein
MDDGIKRIERSIEAYGLWFRLAVMLALAAACLLALRELRPKEMIASAPDLGSRDELERMLGAGLPMKFSEIIIPGKVSATTAGELYQQHRARFEILSWRYQPAASRYAASIRLSWQPDATPGPGEDFWVLAQCSVSKRPCSNFGFKVCKASPDHEKECHAYLKVLLKYYQMR